MMDDIPNSAFPVSDGMQVIIFRRKGFWYPVEYPADYTNWADEAERNPGTTKIETLDGEVLWQPS